MNIAHSDTKKNMLHTGILRIAARIAGTKELIPNPFPNSKIQDPVYHGCRTKNVKKLHRPPHGVWFAGTEGWVDDLYTGM